VHRNLCSHPHGRSIRLLLELSESIEILLIPKFNETWTPSKPAKGLSSLGTLSTDAELRSTSSGNAQGKPEHVTVDRVLNQKNGKAALVRVSMNDGMSSGFGTSRRLRPSPESHGCVQKRRKRPGKGVFVYDGSKALS
jgi:hypothetical protein